MNNRTKKEVHKRTKKRCRFHKRPQFSLRRADLSSQVHPGFNVKVVSMVSALLSASGWVINPHISLRTKLTVLHQDATPNSAPIPNRGQERFNQWTSINLEIKFMTNRTKKDVHNRTKKINGLGTLLCSVNTGEAEVFLGNRFINGDISQQSLRDIFVKMKMKHLAQG